MAHLPTELLHTFVAVVDEGGFSRAARALGLGQSTVSQHVKALEDQVGARLLDRAGRTVHLTATGRLLVGYARRLLRLEEEMLAAVRQEEAGEGGKIVIAASTIPADFLLPPLLARFARRRPEVSITIDVSDSRKATDALLAGACDLAIVGAPVRDKRVVASRFAEDEVVLAGPTRGPHAAVKATTKRELARLPLIVREAGSGTREAIKGLLPEREGAGGPAIIQVGSTEAARRCVQSGLGFAFLSRTAIAADVSDGSVRVVRLVGTPVRRSFWLLRLRTVTPSAAARELLHLIAEPARGRREAE